MLKMLSMGYGAFVFTKANLVFKSKTLAILVLPE